MRVLFLTHFFPPTHVGGTEHFTFGVARALHNDMGYAVNVLCAGRWQGSSRYYDGYTDDEIDGIQVRRLLLDWRKAPHPNRYLYDNPFVASLVEQWLPSWDPDIVHVTSCYTLSASIIPVVVRAGVPLVLTLTDYWFICPKLNLLRSGGELCQDRATAQECLTCLLDHARWFRWLKRFVPKQTLDATVRAIVHRPTLARQRGFRGLALDVWHRKGYLLETLRMADALMSPSQTVRQIFLDAGVERPIQMIPHGIDLPWPTLPVNKMTTIVDLHIGYIGQIAPHKGVHLLIQAFARIPAERARLHIYGQVPNNTYGSTVLALAANDMRVRLEGGFPREQIRAVLGNIDVLVVPSMCYETYGLVVLEAFAARVPVVAARLGALGELVGHEVNGLHFTPGSVDDLARQLQRIVQEQDLLHRLRAALPRVKSVQEEAEEIAAVYSEAISRRMRAV